MRTTCHLTPRWRAAPTIAAVVAGLLIVGCGAGHILARDEVPKLAPRDGFLAMAVETDKNCAVTLCRDADMVHCVAFGGLSASNPLAVSVVPAGTYCLSTIIAEDPGGAMASVMNFEADNTTCFDVPAGQIAYPGRLMLNDDGFGWDVDHAIDSKLRATFPKLERWPLRKMPVSER